jgi:adenylate kinase
MQIIILGPPGAGKGTQSLLIAQKLGLIHLSTGEILRKAVEDKTGLGLKAKEIMDKGHLVSDEIMIGIIREAISKDEVKKVGFILDGFPRTLKQAIALDEILSEFGYNDLKIINLVAHEEELLKRLKGRGRSDDTIETIMHRRKVHKEQTEPVIEHYRRKFEVFDIHGVGSINEINNSILGVLTRAIEKKPIN